MSEEAINTSTITLACHDFIASDYIFTFLDDYSCINGVIEQLNDALSIASITDICRQALPTYFCNYIYPGCSLDNPQEPIGICQTKCMTYLFEVCPVDFEFLENLGVSTGQFRFPFQCNNTLQYLVDSGLKVMQDDQECTDISGK